MQYFATYICTPDFLRGYRVHKNKHALKLNCLSHTVSSCQLSSHLWKYRLRTEVNKYLQRGGGEEEEGWSVPEGGEKSVKTSPSSPHPSRSFYKTSIFNTRYITFTNRKSSLRKLIQRVYIQIF